MKKRVTHSEMMRKLDNTDATNPSYLDKVSMIKDSGFRAIVGEMIQKDESRRLEFVKSKTIIQGK